MNPRLLLALELVGASKSRRVASRTPYSAMPELRECLAHFLHFNNIFQTIKPHSSFQLLHLWADAKDGKGSQPSDEDKKYHVTNGLVVCLDDSCTIKRGTNHRQTPIWHPRCKPKAKGYLPLSALELKGGEGTSRAILLDFGPLWLSVSTISSSDNMHSLITCTDRIPNTYLSPVVQEGDMVSIYRCSAS